MTKYQVGFPYIKAYADHKNKVRYAAYRNQDIRAMYQPKNIGDSLLDFVLLDLSDYKERMETLLEDTKDDFSIDNELAFAIYNAEIYETARLLAEVHPIAYFYLFGKLNTVFSSEIPDTEQMKMAVKVLEEIWVLQEMFADGLTMCCDIDFDNEGISQSGRFLAFTALHQDFMNCYLLTGAAIVPTKGGEIDFDMIDTVNQDGIEDKKEQLAIIDKLNESGANIVAFTLLQGFSEFLYYEFTELLGRGLRVRKCKHCGKYFVLQSKHETYYCDRIDDKGRNCKKLGNKLEYQAKVAADPELLEYERVYKLRHAQMERDELKEIGDSGEAKKEFKQWSKMAKEVRKKYLNGTIDSITFLQDISSS